MVESRRPGRPRTGVFPQVAVRMSPALIEAIDKHRTALGSKTPGTNPTRADAIRNLLELGLREAKRARGR